MCRNDKKLLKYELTLDLFGKVQPFEVEDGVLEKWKEIIQEYEVKFEEFVKLNKTYDEDFKNYEGDLKQYEDELEDRKNAPPDPYGDED